MGKIRSTIFYSMLACIALTIASVILIIPILTIVFGVLAVILFIALPIYNSFEAKSTTKNFSNITNQYINEHRIKADKLYYSDTNSSCLIFDHGNQSLYILKDGKAPTSLPYAFITESELMENGDTITKTARGKQIGTALVGGMIGGALGGVVGGLTSEKTSSDSVKSIELKIVTDDLYSPVSSFFVKEYGNNIEKSSINYRKLYDDAYEIHKTISLIIKKQGEK